MTQRKERKKVDRRRVRSGAFEQHEWLEMEEERRVLSRGRDV